MSSQRVSKVLLQYTIDKAGLREVEKGSNLVLDTLEQTKKRALSSTDAMGELNKEFAQLGRQQALKEIAANFGALPPQLTNTRRELERLTGDLADLGATEDEIKQVARAIANVGDEAERAGRATKGVGIDRADAFGKASTGIGSIASVAGGIAGSGAGAGLQLAGDVAGAAEQLPALVSGIAALGPVGVAVGIAAAGAAIAIGNQIAATQKLTEATLEQIAAENEARNIALTGTRAEIQAARDKAAADRDLAAALLALRAADLETAKANAGYATGLDEVRKNLGLAFGEIKAQEQDVEALIKAYDAASTKVSEFDAVLASSGPTLGDAKAAEAALAEAREESAQKTLEAAKAELQRLNALLDANVNAELNARLQADKLTAEQAELRIAAAQREQAIIRDILEKGGGSADNIERLTQRLSDLGTEVTTLTNELPRLNLRDSIAAAIQGTQDSIRLNAERADALAAIDTKLNDRIKSLASDRANAILSAQQEAGKAEIKAGQDRERALSELAIKQRQDRLKIEEDYQKSVRQIEKRFNRSRADAVAERDTLAAFQAEQARKDELDAAKDAKDEGLRNLNRQLQEQGRLIQQRYNDQLVAINDRLNEQTRIAAERYNQQVQLAQTAAQQEQSVVQQKYAKEIALAQQGSQALISITGNFWGTALQIARNATSALTAQSNSLGGVLGSLFGAAKKALFPSFDTGGAVLKSGLASVKQGEVILTQQQQQRSFAGAGSVQVNVNASTKESILAEVAFKLNKELDKIF